MESCHVYFHTVQSYNEALEEQDPIKPIGSEWHLAIHKNVLMNPLRITVNTEAFSFYF
jgi:hypothetical protein